MLHRRSDRSLALLSLLLAAGLCVLAASCTRHTDVAAEIEAQIEAYKMEPSDALQSRIEASFARLDAEVAEMRADAETKTGPARDETLGKADALAARGSELRKRFYAARFGAASEAAKNAVKQLGVTIGKGLESAGEKMKDALGGDGTKDGTGADAAPGGAPAED
jgi:hypothetical protein